MPSACGGRPFKHWNGKATALRSNLRHEREVGSTGVFLSKATAFFAKENP
jgi:hypothetical protein